METREAQSEEDKDDFVEHLFSAQLHDFLLFFTNTGRMYRRARLSASRRRRAPARAAASRTCSTSAPRKRSPRARILEGREAAEDEAMWAADRYVLFATKDGTVKKTALEEFKNYRKDGIIAIKIDEGNDLVDVVLTDGNKEVCLVTHEGMCVRFHETATIPHRPTSAPSAAPPPACAASRWSKDDFLVSCVTNEPDTMLLVVSENGLGKRTPFDEYRLINRGGKGVTTMNVTEKTGKVVAALAVHDTDELMLMTSKGQSVRIRVGANIRETGRNAQGVRLMNLSEGELIQDVASVITEAETGAAARGETGDAVDEPQA